MDLIANDDPYVLRFCNGTWTSERCAIEAFELERVGQTWPELMETISFGEEKENDKVCIKKTGKWIIARNLLLLIRYFYYTLKK